MALSPARVVAVVAVVRLVLAAMVATDRRAIRQPLAVPVATVATRDSVVSAEQAEPERPVERQALTAFDRAVAMVEMVERAARPLLQERTDVPVALVETVVQQAMAATAAAAARVPLQSRPEYPEHPRAAMAEPDLLAASAVQVVPVVEEAHSSVTAVSAVQVVLAATVEMVATVRPAPTAQTPVLTASLAAMVASAARVVPAVSVAPEARRLAAVQWASPVMAVLAETVARPVQRGMVGMGPMATR